MLLFGRQYEAAIGAARRALQLEPGRLRATAFLGVALFMLGHVEDARRQFQTLPADDYRRLVGEAAIAAHEGRRQNGALKAIPAIGERYRDAAYYEFAEVYARKLGLGNGERSRQRPRNGMGRSGTQALLPSRWDPFLDPARKDDRVSAIAARVFG